jgi:hypothetical protein
MFVSCSAVLSGSSNKPALPHGPEAEDRDYILCIPATSLQTAGNVLPIYNPAWALYQFIYVFISYP